MTASIRSSLLHFWVLLSIFHTCQNMCASHCSVSFMTTSVSHNIREVLGNVYDFTIFIVFCFRWVIPNLVDLLQLDISFGFGVGAAYSLLENVVCARGLPHFHDCGENTPKIWWSVSAGKTCRACCSIHRDIRTQDFEFPGCRDGTCTFIHQIAADLNISIPVNGPILTWSWRIACNLEFWESLVLNILCMKDKNSFHPWRIHW